MSCGPLPKAGAVSNCEESLELYTNQWNLCLEWGGVCVPKMAVYLLWLPKTMQVCTKHKGWTYKVQSLEARLMSWPPYQIPFTYPASQFLECLPTCTSEKRLKTCSRISTFTIFSDWWETSPDCPCLSTQKTSTFNIMYRKVAATGAMQSAPFRKLKPTDNEHQETCESSRGSGGKGFIFYTREGRTATKGWWDGSVTHALNGGSSRQKGLWNCFFFLFQESQLVLCQAHQAIWWCLVQMGILVLLFLFVPLRAKFKCWKPWCLWYQDVRQKVNCTSHAFKERIGPVWDAAPVCSVV